MVLSYYDSQWEPIAIWCKETFPPKEEPARKTSAYIQSLGCCPPPPPRKDLCRDEGCAWYASYWKAFLFYNAHTNNNGFLTTFSFGIHQPPDLNTSYNSLRCFKQDWCRSNFRKLICRAKCHPFVATRYKTEVGFKWISFAGAICGLLLLVARADFIGDTFHLALGVYAGLCNYVNFPVWNHNLKSPVNFLTLMKFTAHSTINLSIWRLNRSYLCFKILFSASLWNP